MLNDEIIVCHNTTKTQHAESSVYQTMNKALETMNNINTKKESVYPFKSLQARDEYLSWYDRQAQENWPHLPMNEVQYIHTSFGDTFVRMGGGGDGSSTTTAPPPLVIVPGDGETSLAFSLVVESLSQHYRVFCLDHINDVGRSIPNKDHKIKCPSDLVQWLDEVLDGLHLQLLVDRKVYLMGHSYGGWICTLYALVHPERLEKLVLLAPPAAVGGIPFGLLVRAILYGLFPNRWYIQRYMYWFAPDCVQDKRAKCIVDNMIEEQLLARKCFKPRKFIIPTKVSDKQWQTLSVPTLYMVGEHDVTNNSVQASVELLERLAPKMIQCIIASPGDHHLYLIRPEWTCERVVEFLGF